MQTAFQIGAFQFTAFQEGVGVDTGGWLPRHRRPVFLPAKLYDDKSEEDLRPIIAVAHSTAGASYTRAVLRFTTKIIAAKGWTTPSHSLAKVVHDPFPITCVALSKNASTTRAVAKLELGVVAGSLIKAKTKAITSHDTELQQFADLAELLGELEETT